MPLEDMLKNRSLMLKIIWLGFISSIAIMGIGAAIIILQLLS